MAVTGHQGKEEIIKGSKIIYGVAPFKVVAINPTMEQLVEMGVNAQKDPEYVQDKTRIEIWLQSCLEENPVVGSPDKSLAELGLNKQMLHKLSIFISNTKKGKSDGSTYSWINSFGSICSVPVGGTPSETWWKKNQEHVSREGEIELIKFIRAWINAGPTDEVYIEDWEALVAGNVKELNDILKLFPDNVVRSMIEVKDSNGKFYPGIYNGHHLPWNITSITSWVKEFKIPKRNRYFSYILKEFVPTLPQPTEDATPTNSEWS